jgi:hypothetical protein
MVIWIENAHLLQTINLGCDQSVVAHDLADGRGVEVWYSKYGNLAVKESLATIIYPQ